MNAKIKASLGLLGALALAACADQGAGRNVNAAPTGSAAAGTSGQVHTIEMPKFQSDLPEGPGRELVATACLSCHSTRYIAMQPPLNAAKWEENVRKMMKTFGAPIAEDQVQPIVQYLMATRESKISSGSWIVRAANTERKATPKLDLTSANLEKGKAVYARACASCHGEKGAGNGVSAGPLLPRPTNLTHAAYSREFMADAIFNGVPATAMPGFSTLSQDDLRDVVAYSLSLGQKPADAKASGDVAVAKDLYQQHCMNCHGADGAGDGIAAGTSPRPPANFKVKQPTNHHAMMIISDGVAGSTMPQWKAKLSEAQRMQLAEYVRGFYQE
ncbi:MAG TPA: c-type cytochrome [Tepidisphaeraceae bacterium]|jgi:mono/diheme cytochrome c family protein